MSIFSSLDHIMLPFVKFLEDKKEHSLSRARYLGKRAFELISGAILMIGMAYALFIIFPSLDKSEHFQFGANMIIVLLAFVAVYSIANNYLESRRQRKLDAHLDKKRVS